MRAFVAVLTAILLLCMGLVVLAQAEVVGRMTQVEGRVDFLKGGKLPAAEAKLNDGVEVGDVLRTKSLSKAQITFMDNTVITVSPESRIAVEEYMFDPAKGKRSAMLQLFQGLAHVVVSKLFKVSEPDFVVKTHTAVMGVRGTEIGIRLHPNSSTILNFEGHTEVGNIFPEVGDLLFKKAYKIAFSWGGPSSLHLRNMQGTTVFSGLPPTQAYTITPGEKQQFMGQVGGLIGQSSSGGGTQTGGGGGGSGGSSSYSVMPAGVDSGGVGNPTPTTTPIPLNLAIEPTVFVPTTEPTPTPPTPPTPGTYSLSATTYSKWDSTAATGGLSSTVNSTGWAQTTSSWSSSPLYYTSNSTNASRTWSQGALLSSSSGTASGTLTGSVYGIPGSTLTGTGTYIGMSSYGSSATLPGTIVVDPSGQLTFTYSGGTLSSNASLVSGSGTIIYTPGTYFGQSTDGASLRTSNDSSLIPPYTPPYSTATSTTTGTGLWAGGSRLGVLPGSFDLALGGTDTSPWSYSYQANELGDVTGTMRGVVSPGVAGAYQGAMTIFSSNPDMPFTSSLLPQFQPSFYLFPGYGRDSGPMVSSMTINPNGSANGTAYSTYFQDWRFASSVFNLSQTVPQTAAANPVSAVYNFQEAYNGAFQLNNSAANGMGWGQRTFNGSGSTAGTSVYNTFLTSYDSGAWTPTTGTLPMYYGSSLTPYTGPLNPITYPPYGTAPGTAQITGSVSGTLGHTLSGNMTYIGSLLNGASFSYSGPVSVSNDGYLTFNYKNTGGYSSTWVFPGGVTGTATGYMYQNPGYYFTQNMSGDNFTITQTSAKNWNISLSNSSASGGLRTGVFGGGIGTFSGALALSSPTANAVPAFFGSGTGAVSIDLEGVVNNSTLGATSGVATANINLTGLADQLSLGFVPGTVSLTDSGVSGVAGGSFFSPAPVFVQNNTPYAVQVTGSPSQNYLVQTPAYNFSESLQGFRINTVTANPTLSSIEGYAWGQRTGSTALSGGGNSYLGYFVSQDLGTRASATPLTSNILGVTATLSGALSGTLGQTLSGQALLTGSNSSGTTFTYQGTVSLSATGQLIFNYGGNFTTASGSSGTGSGNIQQVPGTYFTETLTGNYQQAPSTTGTTNFLATTSTTALSGTRTVDPGGANTTTGTTASIASGLSSTVNTLTPTSGAVTLNVNGVVAGADWQSKWGVASVNGTVTPSGGTAIPTPTTTGPVTIDTVGTLTTQSVGTIANGSILPPDTVTNNLISVPTASGLSTASFAATATGAISQTATSDGSGKTVINTAPLTGTSGGVPINANLAITSTALLPGSYTSGAGTATINQVGVVAGPAGGVQTGVSTVQAVKTVGSTTTSVFVGSTVATPATGSTPATLTTALSGINSVPAPPAGTGAGATQTGTLSVIK